MHIIVPMSGIGKRFIDAGYKDPKPLIVIDGKPIIEHAKPSAGTPNRSASTGAEKKPYRKDGGNRKDGAPKRTSGSRDGRK